MATRTGKKKISPPAPEQMTRVPTADEVLEALDNGDAKPAVIFLRAGCFDLRVSRAIADHLAPAKPGRPRRGLAGGYEDMIVFRQVWALMQAGETLENACFDISEKLDRSFDAIKDAYKRMKKLGAETWV